MGKAPTPKPEGWGMEARSDIVRATLWGRALVTVVYLSF